MQNDDLKWECKRLQTFRDYGWPSSAAISCEKLAKAGFHYAGAHDEVICCWCNLRHAFWKFTDQAIAVHAQNSPNCAFIRNPAESGNVPSANYSSVPIQNVTSSGQNVPESDVQPRSRSGSASSGYFNITRSGSSTSVAAEAAAKFRAEKVIRISEAPNLMCETDRFRTFRNWPNMHVNPAELARWGFYYTGTADTVECIFCRGRLNNWLAHEFPYVEHRKHFPQCRFIQGLEVGNISDDSGASSSSEGNRNLTSVSINLLPLPLVTPSVGGSIPVPLVTPSVGGSAVTSITFHNNNVENENHAANDATSDDYKKHLKELGVFTDTPACPEMATQAARLSTFNGWPPDSIQHPQQLVDAGFYYSGTGDAVKCFQCSGGLRNWLPGDDVWVEHARWFPRCEYVRMNKGDAFVRTVLEKFSKSNGEKAIKSVDKMQGQIVVRVEEDKELASGVDTGVDMRSLGAVTLETLKLHGGMLSVLKIGFSFYFLRSKLSQI